MEPVGVTGGNLVGANGSGDGVVVESRAGVVGGVTSPGTASGGGDGSVGGDVSVGRVGAVVGDHVVEAAFIGVTVGC